VTGLPELQPGAIFASDFQVERPLAKGGMGAVYVARQLSTGRARALKLMHPMLASDEGMRRRFEQEAQVGSHIKSSHVVEVIAAGVDAASGMPWLAMELLEGEDLGQHVARLGPRPFTEVAAVFSQLCHALAAAHDVGVVHRDLKPENVFLARSLQQGVPTLVKLLDLGIAKIVAETSPRHTQAVGTPLWMAPEQMGGSVGPQADVWALGLLAFWMLTGKHYWRAAASLAEGSLLGVLREVASDPLEPPSLRAPALGVAIPLPAGFDAWFARCVARDAQTRFANAGLAQRAFSDLAGGIAQTVVASVAFVAAPSGHAGGTQLLPTTAAPAATQPLRAGPRPVWALGLLAAVVAGGAALALSQRQAAGLSPPATSAPAASLSAVSRAKSAQLDAPAPARLGADLNDSSIVWQVPLGDAPVRGAADAPVTIVELANYQCPFTKGIEAGLVKLQQELAGKVRLVWKDDPLAVHSQAELAAGVAREARAQKGDVGFWAAHDAMLAADFKPSSASVLDVAKRVGLNVHEVELALSQRRYADAIAQDAELADDLMAVGTPYFFVNGRRVTTTGSLDKLREVVAEELAKADALAKQGVAPASIYDRLTQAGRGPTPLEIKAFDFATITGPTRGAGKAEVMITEFCDYKSYLCKLVDPMVDELLQKFPQDLGVTWSEPDHFVSDDSRRAALAARASYRLGGTDAFDKMRRLLFERQAQPFTASNLTGYGASLGLPRSDFAKLLEDPELFGEIELEASRTRDSAIKDVPVFLVCGSDYCKSGGYLLRGGQPRRAFDKRIRLALSAKGAPLSASP
jgi:eukaryotic-like serine/threonine-protein kinase